MERIVYSDFAGDWSQFSIRQIEPKDFESVLDILKNGFLHEEPTLLLLGQTDLFAKELGQFFKKILEQRLSFIALDKDSGNIASILIGFLRKKENVNDFSLRGLHKCSQIKIVLKIINETEYKAQIFQNFRVDQFVDLFASYTVPKYRNQGLLSEIYRRAINYLKICGYPLVKSIFTNPYCREVAAKLGFVELSRVDYLTMRSKRGKGARVFKSSNLSHLSFACLMVKILNEN